MRSSGLSVLRIIRPVIIFGVLVSAFIFWIGDRFVPPSLALTEKIKGQMESGGKKSQEKEVIENLSMYGMKNRLFFINKFFPATSTMEGIVILEHDEHQDITKKIVANKGAYTNGMWKFYHSITYELDANGQVKKEPQFFQEELMNIPESPVEFLTQRQRPDFMTIAQLDNYIWKLSKSGAAPVVRNFRIDLYQRFTTPLMSVLVMLLAVPFSLAMHKRATGMSSIGISIMVGFLYYVVNAIAVNLGKAGILTPVLAVTFSHISVLLTALYLIGKLP
jgi:lipopolysaccharide export system permease protein